MIRKPRQHRRLITRAGAGIEDIGVLREPGGGGHHRDDRRRGNRLPVRNVQRAIGEGLLAQRGRNERLARHLRHHREDARQFGIIRIGRGAVNGRPDLRHHRLARIIPCIGRRRSNKHQGRQPRQPGGPRDDQRSLR